LQFDSSTWRAHGLAKAARQRRQITAASACTTSRRYTLQLTVFSTFEVVAAFLHRAGFNAVVVVVYRPGSCNAMQSFFDDFSDLLQERLSMLSAPLMISGDFNIYVDRHSCQ